MKKIIVITLLCFCVFILTGLKSSTKEYVTEAWASEHFGRKFISAREIGLGKLQILFTVDELKYDEMSWLMPLERNGVLAYRLIQARYGRNESEPNDTLSLVEAKKVIQVITKAGRRFPNNEGLVFLKTGDLFSVNGIEYAKTIVLDKKSYQIIDLPTNVSVVIVGKDTHRCSYISNIIGGVALSLDASDNLTNKEELSGSSVMTLTELIPSQ